MNNPNMVEALYEMGKFGQWTQVCEQFNFHPDLGLQAARYVSPQSGWALLHQAAYWGNDDAAKQMIRFGANISKKSVVGETAIDIAKKRGYHALSKFLEEMTYNCDPPSTDLYFPASAKFSNARKMYAPFEMKVIYGNLIITIPENGTHYVDQCGRTLVGWHGSYLPPKDMDGNSLMDC